MGAIAGPLVQGLFADDAQEDQQRSVEAQQDKNIAFQKEFAQHGVRWRVEDAKAAGVHPMYALGASGAAFAPNPIVLDGGGGSRHYGEAFGKGLQQIIAALFQANQAKDLALSQAVGSNAALASTVAQSSTPFPRDYGDLGDEFDITRWQRVGAVPMNLQNAIDSQQLKPDERVSSRSGFPGVSAATGRPEAMEVEIPGGLRMLLPHASNPAEAHEALGESPLEHLRWLQINSDHYGPGWMRSYLKQYPGLKQLIQIGEELGEFASRPSRTMPPARRTNDYEVYRQHEFQGDWNRRPWTWGWREGQQRR